MLYGGSPAAFDIRYETTPMGAIETQMIDCAYSEIGKHLGMPTQAYTAMSDAKQLDAQCGLETAMGATLAALAGVNHVSGPGMLDYLLTFSIPKLVIDDEIVGQALHFQGQIDTLGDIPTTAIIEEMFEEGHALVAEHTMANWQSAMYLPGELWDRDARDAWTTKGELDIVARATAEVDRLLDSYEMPEADPVLGAAARAIISGLLPKIWTTRTRSDSQRSTGTSSAR